MKEASLRRGKPRLTSDGKAVAKVDTLTSGGEALAEVALKFGDSALPTKSAIGNRQLAIQKSSLTEFPK